MFGEWEGVWGGRVLVWCFFLFCYLGVFWWGWVVDVFVVGWWEDYVCGNEVVCDFDCLRLFDKKFGSFGRVDLVVGDDGYFLWWVDFDFWIEVVVFLFVCEFDWNVI